MNCKNCNIVMNTSDRQCRHCKYKFTPTEFKACIKEKQNQVIQYNKEQKQKQKHDKFKKRIEGLSISSILLYMLFTFAVIMGILILL